MTEEKYVTSLAANVLMSKTARVSPKQWIGALSSEHATFCI